MQGPFLCNIYIYIYIYGRRFYATYRLMKAEMIKQFYPCGFYQYQLMIVGTRDLQPKMVWSPLIATWRVHRLLQAVISRFAAKIQLPVRKILLLSALTLKCCSQMDSQ